MKDNLLNFDFKSFWNDCKYAKTAYVGKKINDKIISEFQKKSKYKLPISYINLLKNRNGGLPKNTSHRMNVKTSWAVDHIAITGIFGIDSKKNYSITGKLGSQFMIDSWGYPDIGIYFCDCPSAGHDMLCLDYSSIDNSNEPKVVHIDQEYNYKKTIVADCFEDFIRGLVSDEIFT